MNGTDGHEAGGEKPKPDDESKKIPGPSREPYPYRHSSRQAGKLEGDHSVGRREKDV